MKKIWTILILLMMLISISSLAIADEADEDEEEQGDVDSETEKEIQIMNNPLGAEIRLLQLQKALLKNMLKGIMVVQVLKGLGNDTTALEAILAQMKNLSEAINDTNASSEGAVQLFVEFKSQAKNLTTQFRETLREMFDDEALNQLRETIRQIIDDKIEDLGKHIRNRIRQFNLNQLYILYGLIGKENQSLIEEYLNGTVTINLSKIQICKIINNMTKDRRYLIFSEIKEENIKKKINAEAFIDEMHNKGKGKGKWG